MRRLSLRGESGAALAAAAAVALAALTSCRSLPRAAPVLVPPSFSADTLVEAPAIRIGIVTDAGKVSIGADSGIAVWIGPTGSATLRRVGLAVATFRRTGAATAGTRIFRAQIASLGDAEAARQASEGARDASNLPPTVTWNRETATYQVRLGAFAAREEAVALSRKLSDAGFRGSFVVEEQSTSPGATLQLLETGEELALATIVPERAGEPLTVDSTAYRGLLEIRPGDGGALTVVNVLNMEDYLRGVVPNELSPQAFPQIEALKAQAIAARTYALRNRGQFQAKGYDLCATPTCQVYRGRSTENPLSDQAVAETRGLVARYQGEPINALYTSTCGGHTEDGANIFEGTPTPYLKGVACLPERSATAGLKTTAPAKGLGDEEGLNRDAALLVSLDVIDAKLLTAAGAEAGRDRRRRARLDRPAADGPAPQGLRQPRRGAFRAEALLSSIWWARCAGTSEPSGSWPRGHRLPAAGRGRA